jgi:hypothetical protein
VTVKAAAAPVPVLATVKPLGLVAERVRLGSGGHAGSWSPLPAPASAVGEMVAVRADGEQANVSLTEAPTASDAKL